MRKNHDILWKSIIEDVFDDLLRFIFPDADEVFDIKRGFEFLDKELAGLYPGPGRRPETRFVDKLVKVYRRDGNEEWILCHIEVQGETRKKVLFAERMFQYYYRIFDLHRKPMTAIAIFTAKDGSMMPDRYEYHFLGTSHVYRYNTYCITEATDEALEKSDNPFAIVVLAARKALLAGKIPEEELLNQKTLIARLLLEKKRFSREKVRSILTFLNNYIVFKDPGTNHNFTKTIDNIIDKKNPMGIIEAMADIRARELVKERWKEYQKEARKEVRKEMQEEVRKEVQEEVRKEVQEEVRKEVRKEVQEEVQEEVMVEGLFIGDEKRSLIVIENLLKDTDFSLEKIANLAGVSAAFVKRVKRGYRLK